MRDTSSATPESHRLSKPLQALRLARLALHLLGGLATVALIYPLVAQRRRLELRRRWSLRLLAILGICLRKQGAQIEASSLLVANHISWVDIFVINAIRPASFVSKDDVRHWPLIGWLATRNGTLFLQRGSRRQAHAMSEAVGAVLCEGGNVAVFPEGTTTEGRAVRHFHAALLQPAIDAGRPVQPLALRYLAPDGAYCAAPAYVGETSLWECLKAIVAEPAIVATLDVMAPIPSTEGPRRTLAEAARHSIAARVAGDYASGTAFETDRAFHEPAAAEAAV
jgi:1-acyl-sn-glycerol-3-phosphate acyltransferase